MRPYARYDGILLANHGALTVGSDVYSAYDRMETLEHSAHIYVVARTLGSERPLSEEHVAKLREIREKLQFTPPSHACMSCKVLEDRMQRVSTGLRGLTEPGPEGTYNLTREELIDLITDVVKTM